MNAKPAEPELSRQPIKELKYPEGPKIKERREERKRTDEKVHGRPKHEKDGPPAPFTQPWMAERIGVSANTYARWEQGQYEPAERKHRVLIAKLLDSPGEFGLPAEEPDVLLISRVDRLEERLNDVLGYLHMRPLSGVRPADAGEVAKEVAAHIDEAEEKSNESASTKKLRKTGGQP